jgi:hypothetical protein
MKKDITPAEDIAPPKEGCVRCGKKAGKYLYCKRCEDANLAECAAERSSR